MPHLLSLTAISAATAGKVVVEVRSGWVEPVGIYTGCILPPASRKSPAFKAMTDPIRKWEADAVRRAMPLVLAAQDAVEVAQIQLEKAKRDAGKKDSKPDAVKKAREELEKALAQTPLDGRLLAGDITPEAIVLRMAAQGGRLAILEPEPGPLQLVAGRYSDTARLDELKKAWSGEELLVDRVGRPPLRVPRPALTLGLCLQPGVLEALQNGPAFRVEGLLGRVLWCRPPHGLGSRLTGPDVPPLDRDASAGYSRILRTLLDAEPAGENEDGIPKPHILRLDQEALEVLHRFESEVEPDLADGGRFEAIRDWEGKAVGESTRIAAHLELAARAGDRRPLFLDPIGSEAMENAIRIVRALSSHAALVFGEMGMDEEMKLLRYLLQRVQELVKNPPPEEKGGASLRNLFEMTKGKSEIGTMDDLKPLVEKLVDRGCIRLREQKRPGSGRHSSPLLEIHPKLLESTRTIRTNGPQSAGKGESANSANGRQTRPPKTKPPSPIPENSSEKPSKPPPGSRNQPSELDLWTGGPVKPEGDEQSAVRNGLDL